MAWDSKTDAAITRSRLMLLPPEAVYQELREYAHYQEMQTLAYGDEDLERGLLGRHEPLIDLGLASCACNIKIVKELYIRGLDVADNENDRTHRKGLRVACLSNRVAGSAYDGPELWMGEHLSTLLYGDREERAVLLGNPHIGGYFLKKLYAKEGPFADMSDEQWRVCVLDSSVNPRLNIKEDNAEAPDLAHSGCHKSILKLLETAPADRDWAVTLHYLLENLDPDRVAWPEGDIDHILRRWEAVPVIKTYGESDGKESEGHYTGLSFNKEFLILIAALYGKTLRKTGKSSTLGDADSPDVMLRCAYYGNASMKPSEMKSGYERDHDVFVYAALLNGHLYHRIETRVLLEEYISGYFRYLYQRRCQQIHDRNASFDPRPISERGIAKLDETPAVAPELAALNSLNVSVESLKVQVNTLKSIVFWGLIGVAAITFIFR